MYSKAKQIVRSHIIQNGGDRNFRVNIISYNHIGSTYMITLTTSNQDIYILYIRNNSYTLKEYKQIGEENGLCKSQE